MIDLIHAADVRGAIDPMDLVRDLFAAINDVDMDRLTAAYHADCVIEDVFSDAPHITGREALLARWRTEFDRRPGALAGGHRIAVSRIAGLETGWGWVRADWRSAVRESSASAAECRRGYSHFWIEDGLIRRHRDVSRAETVSDLAAPSAVAGSRTYPTRPIVGVGAVIVSADGRVVLVKRRHEPLAGQWSLPGGTLEVGESLEAGVAREMLEETGLIVDVGPVVEVFDRILVDDEARVRYHFVLVDYLCRPRGGALAPGGDADDVAWVAEAGLGPYRLTEKALAVIQKALARDRGER